MAAMAAVVGNDVGIVGVGDNAVKIPKKKAGATATAAAAVELVVVVSGSSTSVPFFCPIPVKARVVSTPPPPLKPDDGEKKKKRRAVSDDDEKDTIDVEDAQRERAYAMAEELSKRRLAAAAAPKRPKVTLALATPSRVLAELDPHLGV